MRLGLHLTARCNAQCLHCSVQSGPRRSEALDPAEVMRLMDEAAALRKHDEPLLFQLTGGEAFLDFEGLLTLVAHGTRLGGTVSCTTNAFWASSEARAEESLRGLKQAGLRLLGVSTSRFHLQYIPLQRVGLALAAAAQVGIETLLKCAVTRSDQEAGWAEQLARSLRPDRLQVFPVVPFLRSGMALPDEEYPRQPGVPEGTCPAALLTVREDGTAYTCCTPGADAPLLALGSVYEHDLKTLFDVFNLNGTQQVLRRYGPGYFAAEIRAQGCGHRLRPDYAGVCDLCAHIARDPVLSSIAADAAERFSRDQIREVMEYVRLRTCVSRETDLLIDASE